MNNEDTIGILKQLRSEIDSFPHTARSTEFTRWKHTVRSVLTRSLGATHHVTEAFVTLSWIPRAVYATGNEYQYAFVSATPRAQGLLDAAIYELEVLGSASDLADDAGFDPELWAFVSADVAAGEWGKVASQTAIFTEDRVRKWTGRPPEEVGHDLMTAVFGDKGDYRLGLTQGEKQGWHRFAMGISMALRNADAHRIQIRADHKLYAMGVLGASSLLLTQLRYEHANRFHDTSPAGGQTTETPI